MRRKYPEREDARYLELREKGKTIETIAWLCDVDKKTVRKGIAAAKRRIKKAVPIPTKLPGPHYPEIELWFGSSCKPLKLLTCADVHHGPIPKGSKGCCAAEDCYQSGQDHHPAMRRSAATDPARIAKPDPKGDPNRKPRGAQAAA